MGKFKNPAKKLKEEHEEKNYNAFTQIKNDNDRIVIDNQHTQCCIVPDNVQKDQNNTKDTKLDNNSDKTFSTSLEVSSDTSCKITNVKSEYNDIVHKKAATFIKKVLHKELPKDNKQLSLVLLIQSRQLTKLSQLDLEDEVIKKGTEVFHYRSRYAKQNNNISAAKGLQRFWLRKFRKLTKYINKINDCLNTLVRMPNKAIKHVRNAGTTVNIYKPNKKLSK